MTIGRIGYHDKDSIKFLFKFRMVSPVSLVSPIKVSSIGILSGPPFGHLCVCVCSCKDDLINGSCSLKGNKNEGTENTDVPINISDSLMLKI